MLTVGHGMIIDKLLKISKADLSFPRNLKILPQMTPKTICPTVCSIFNLPLIHPETTGVMLFALYQAIMSQHIFLWKKILFD